MYIDCYCIISHNQLDMYTTVHVFTIETPNCLSNNVLFHTIQVSANIKQVSKGRYVHTVKYTLKLSKRKRGRSKQIDFPLEIY